MGYSTYHKLNTKGATKEQDENLLKMFKTEEDEYNKDWGWTVAEFNEEEISGESSKWYDSDKDMKELSAREEYKDVLFILEGEGEENDDMWKAYFKNGKMQKAYAEFTFPKFDESKLE